MLSSLSLLNSSYKKDLIALESVPVISFKPIYRMMPTYTITKKPAITKCRGHSQIDGSDYCVYMCQNIYCGNYGASNEYPQHMFLWRTGENYPTILTKYSFFFYNFIFQTISCLHSTVSTFIKYVFSVKYTCNLTCNSKSLYYLLLNNIG